MPTDTPIVCFYIRGFPAPGGSKTAFPLRRRDGSYVFDSNGRIIINMVDDAGERNKQWKKAVAIQAKIAYRGVPLDEPLDVFFEFFLERPKGHYRTGSFANELKADAPKYPTSKPDALKLARSTEDALTGILWTDDAGNVDIAARKRYAKLGEASGCRVRVYRVDEWAPTLLDEIPEKKLVHPATLLPGHPGPKLFPASEDPAPEDLETPSVEGYQSKGNP